MRERSPLVRWGYSRPVLLRLSPHASNGHRIEAIRLSSQALTLVKLMRLSRMYQAELIAALLQRVIQVFDFRVPSLPSR